MTVAVMAAASWPTNAHLIEDVARLGHLTLDDYTLDPTFGRGVWWQRWRPHRLEAHDATLDGVDFRELPYADGTFDAVAFDPPYVSVGGRATTGIAEMHDRYGLTDAPTSPKALQAMIDGGLCEARRVVKPRGVVLVKCADYVSSGQIWPGTHLTLDCAFALGLRLVDRFEHVGSARPQPPGRRQVHARRNLSTLFVLKAPR